MDHKKRIECGIIKIGVYCIIFAMIFTSLCCASQSSDSDQNALLLLLLAGSGGSSSGSCTDGTSLASGVYLADTITSSPAHTGSGFKDANKAINGICGGGNTSGGVDVFSLDATGTGATLVLEWQSKRITNGAGIDFTVFENSFYINGNSTTRFMDLTLVEVSIDNTNYCGFAPNYTNVPETTYSNNPATWSNFAGKTPVLLNQKTNNLSATDSFDNSKSGGDSYDLANLSDVDIFSNGCTTTIRNNIQALGFVYIRLKSAISLTNPDTGANFVGEPISDGSDIDGVIARYQTIR